MSYVVRRLAISVALLIVISIVIFVVLRALPGDPVLARLGAAPGVTGETIERLRQEAGLDQPLVAQYVAWVSGFFRGDLGFSYFSRLPVTTLLAERIAPTLELTLLTVVLSVMLAVPAAIFAVSRPGSWRDRVATLLSSAGMAFPPFIAGILLILVFSIGLGWLPARGYTPFTENPGDNLVRMVAPALALTIAASPLVFRHLRGTLGEAMTSHYARTAAGKGASSHRVVLRHALSNAAIPSLTMVGLIFGYTLGGSVIVEYAFGISGLGSLAIESAFRRDYAVLQSVVLLASTLFLAVTLLVDLLTWRLDPRIRVKHG